MENLQKRGWWEVMAQAESLELNPLEGFLAGFATKAASEGLSGEQLRELLMQPSGNMVLNLVLASQGLSFEQQPERVRARLAVAVVNLQEVGLWPY